MHEAFYGKYFVHAQAVCTRPLLGGEGPGDEAMYIYTYVDALSISLILYTKSTCTDLGYIVIHCWVQERNLSSIHKYVWTI